MRQIFLFAAVVVFIAGHLHGCGGPAKKLGEAGGISAGSGTQGREKKIRFVEDDSLEGLRMRLREVGAPAEEMPQVAVARGKTLSKKQIEKLLGHRIAEIFTSDYDPSQRQQSGRRKTGHNTGRSRSPYGKRRK